MGGEGSDLGLENLENLFVGAYGIKYDGKTNLHYMRYRWYSNDQMRFISPDLLLDINRYAYCDGNPINNIDSMGLYTKEEIWNVASRYFTFYQIYNRKNIKDPNCGLVCKDYASLIASKGFQEFSKKHNINVVNLKIVGTQELMLDVPGKTPTINGFKHAGVLIKTVDIRGKVEYWLTDFYQTFPVEHLCVQGPFTTLDDNAFHYEFSWMIAPSELQNGVIGESSKNIQIFNKGVANGTITYRNVMKKYYKESKPLKLMCPNP